MREKTKDERVRSERQRLKKLYSQLEPARKALAAGLIERAAFMRIECEDLEENLRINNTVPRLHANGRPGAALYLVQVHLLTAKGLPTRQKRQALKRALFKAGCTYPSEVDASDPEGQHFVLECQYTDGDV